MQVKSKHIIFLKASSSVLFVLLVIFSLAMKKANEDHKVEGNLHTYLALGDSYTIGEQVDTKENFPNQLVMLLNEKGIVFAAPEIIAQTGWTTDELQSAIQKATPGNQYDLVTLLIGVNNQYRGRSVDDYLPEFEALLKQAIQFAGNDPGHVIVLSIPDWGVTPFAEAHLPDGQGRNRNQIAKEIDAYNSANKSIAEKYHIHYINITESTREAAHDFTLLADDKLHPSGKEYTKWAKKLAEAIEEKL